MPKSKPPEGLPVPTFRVIVVIVALCAGGWWGWSEFARMQAERQSTELDAAERAQSTAVLAMDGAESIDDLLRTLAESEDPLSRRDAARAIGAIGKSAHRAVPRLREALHDSNARVRAAAMESLVLIAPAAPELFQEIQSALKDEGLFVQDSARDSLNRVDAPVLRQFAQDEDKALREEAILTILTRHLATADEIILWIGDDNREIAIRALQAVYELREDAVAALPEIVRRLQIEDEPLQLAALAALREMRSAAAPAVPMLATLISAKSAPIAEAAAFALFWIGEASIAALPAITSQIRANGWRQDHPLTRYLLEILPLLGPQAASAKPLLLEIFDDPQGLDFARYRALRALATIDLSSADVQTRLRSVLKEPENDFQSEAMLLLAALRPKDPALLPVLQRAFQSRSASTRMVAAWTIADLVGTRPEVIDALSGALRDDHREVKCAAAKALGRLGSAASPALPALRSTPVRPVDREVWSTWGPPLPSVLFDQFDRQTSFPNSEYWLADRKSQTLPEIISEAIERISQADAASQTR